MTIANPFQAMDPMMLTLLMDDDNDFKDILPFMMMQGGQYANGQMNPLMITLLDDKCEVNANVKKFTSLTSDQQKQVARGEYFYKSVGNEATAAAWTDFETITSLNAATPPISAADLTEINKYIDYDFISCEHQSDSSNFKDLLPLMMMGQANMQTMDPMMLMLLVDDDSNDLSLPMLMAMQGQNTGMTPNPLLWLTLLDDSKLTKKQCDAKYAIDYIIEVTDTAGDKTFAKTTTGIRSIVENRAVADYDSQFITNYAKCITDATKEGSDSSLKDILPFMIMNGGTGQIDPLLLTLLADDDSDSDNLLPLLFMNQQPGQQLDPMMLALLLKD